VKYGGLWKRLWFFIGNIEVVKEAIQTVFKQLALRGKVQEHTQRKSLEKALLFFRETGGN
jgi:hypothetical protein